MKKFVFLLGLGIGFVAGSAMGRGPYESLERNARSVAQDPVVRERAAQARDTAVKAAGDAASTVKEKAPEVASSVSGSVSDAAAKITDRGQSDAAQSDHAGGDAEVGEDKPLSS